MKTEDKGIIIPDFFIILKWVEVGGLCASDLQRELDITYKHLHEIKHTFIKLGWIYIQKEDRRHNIYLTERGKKITGIINLLFAEMNMPRQKILSNIKKSKLKQKEDVNVDELLKEVAGTPVVEIVKEDNNVEELLQGIEDINGGYNED